MKDWTRFKNAFRATRIDQKVSGLDATIKELESKLSDVISEMRDDLSETAQASAKLELAKLKAALEETRGERHWLALKRDGLRQANEDDLALEALLASDGPLERAKTAHVDELSQSVILTMEIEDLQDELLLATEAAEELMDGFPSLAAPMGELDGNIILLDLAEDELKRVGKELVAIRKAQEAADRRARLLTEGGLKLSETTAVLKELKKQNAALKEKRAELRALELKRAECARDVKESRAALDEAVQELLKEPPKDKDDKLAKESLKAALLLIQQAKLSIEAAELKRDDHEERLEVHLRHIEALEMRAEVLRRLAPLKKKGLALGKTLNQEPFVSLVLWGQDQTAPQLAEQLGSSYASFAANALGVMTGLEDLRALGATDDDIRAFYEECGWPENWLPPFLRKQEQNWLAVKELLESEDHEELDQIKQAQEAAMKFAEFNESNGVNLAELMEMTGDYNGVDLEKLSSYLKLFSTIVTLGKVGAELRGLTDESDPESDPVEQLMKVDEGIQAIVGAGTGTLDAAARTLALPGVLTGVCGLVPGLDTARTFGESCSNAIQAANHWMSAVADAKVHEQAKREEHRAEAALDKVKSRGRHVASRSSAAAAASMIEFAASICTLTGVAAPVALGLKVGYIGVSLVSNTSAFVVDATQAEQARALLKRAQAGDPVAREEIFRHHGRYACALIAVLAEEGDPMALAIYHNHKITKDMVVRSSAKVLKKYLMRELDEVDDPTSWSDIGDWFSEKGSAVLEFFSSLGEREPSLSEAIDLLKGSTGELTELKSAELTLVKYGAKRYGEVQAAVDAMLRVRQMWAESHERASALPTGSEEALAAKKVFAKWAGKLEELNEAVADSERALEGELESTLALLGVVLPATTLGALDSDDTTALKRSLVPQLRQVADQQRLGLKRVAQAA